jgi:hypothetical protein
VLLLALVNSDVKKANPVCKPVYGRDTADGVMAGGMESYAL